MPITQTQIAQRKNRIGSSDMPALLGLDPRRNAYDVWLEKTGKLAEADNGNAAMYAGTIFEEGVLQHAETELGKLTRNQFRIAKGLGVPLGANIDALIAASGVPVEAKTAGLFGPIREIWGEPGTDEVPDRVIIQATVHMICSATEICHIAAFLGGRGFQMFVVERDAVIADIVSETAIQFWNDHVLKDTPPDNALPHATSIKRIRREPETVVEIDQLLIDEWLFAKERLKAAELVKDEKEIAMLAALGQCEGGRAINGMLTYFAQSRSTVDGKGLKADHPEIYERYLKTSTYRVARFKKQ